MSVSDPIPEMAWPSDYTSAMYGGAPDECNFHWPLRPAECGCDTGEDDR